MNNSISLQDLLNKLREYNPEEVEIVKRTYGKGKIIWIKM